MFDGFQQDADECVQGFTVGIQMPRADLRRLCADSQAAGTFAYLKGMELALRYGNVSPQMWNNTREDELRVDFMSPQSD